MAVAVAGVNMGDAGPVARHSSLSGSLAVTLRAEHRALVLRAPGYQHGAVLVAAVPGGVGEGTDAAVTRGLRQVIATEAEAAGVPGVGMKGPVAGVDGAAGRAVRVAVSPDAVNAVLATGVRSVAGRGLERG